MDEKNELITLEEFIAMEVRELKVLNDPVLNRLFEEHLLLWRERVGVRALLAQIAEEKGLPHDVPEDADNRWVLDNNGELVQTFEPEPCACRECREFRSVEGELEVLADLLRRNGTEMLKRGASEAVIQLGRQLDLRMACEEPGRNPGLTLPVDSTTEREQRGGICTASSASHDNL